MRKLIRRILKEQEDYVFPEYSEQKKYDQIYKYLDKIIKKSDTKEGLLFKDERYKGHWFAIPMPMKSFGLLATYNIIDDICINAGKPISLMDEEGRCDRSLISEVIKEWIKDRYNIIVTGNMEIL
jgi:hypothetical protein